MNTVFKLLPVVIFASALSACGSNGSTGATGATGLIGATGLTGAAGATGATGAAGANGAAGTNGTNGAAGAQGATGSQGAMGPAGPAGTPASVFVPGNLLVSRSVFDSTANFVGQQLPYNATPTTTNASPISVPAGDGTFPNLFTVEGTTADGNFGVTAAAYLDQWAPGASAASQSTNITAQAKASLWDFTSSFSSKSELALTVSQNQQSVTFVGYNAPIDQLDRSNSNTPGLIDVSNTDVATPTYRTVAQLNFADSSLSFTPTNAYAGNNGRAAVLANGLYYIVGNAGNSGKTPKPTQAALDALSMSSGVQSIVPDSVCPFTSVIGLLTPVSATTTYTPPAAGVCGLGSVTNGAANGDQFGFSIASLPTTPATAADKTGKDMNLRGLYVGPDGTMFVTKGSGGNGVNTVYQVGATAALANGGHLPANAAVTVVPGFPTTLSTNLPATLTASNYNTTTGGTVYPFGVWMPNTTTMFVADEGDGVAGDQTSGSGGLWEYQLKAGTWSIVAHYTTGLNLGTAYIVTDTKGVYGTVGANYTTTADGLRTITGQVNADGSYTIYAVTSTIANSIANIDAGADSNQLVTIKITTPTTTPTTTGFSVLQTAPYGQVLRGVAFVPYY